MEEKELFEEYEVRNWEITPRIYKIFGAATIINVLILFAFGQFNLLNAKGCDTPYFGIVCQALDSAYIASTFIGKDNSWESRPYAASEIGDAEEITFIDVSDRLEYPEGYFALANPPANDSSEIGVLPSPTGDSGSPLSPVPSPTDDLINKPAVTPTPNTKVGNQDVPDELFKLGDESAKPAKNTSVGKSKTPKTEKKNPILGDSPPSLDGKVATNKTPKPTPSPTPTPTDTEAIQQFGEKFNKKPLQDFADGVVAKLDEKDPAKKIDLKQPFKVILDGVLNKNGTFDEKKTKFVVKKGENETAMTIVAKDAIQKLGDSGLLSYLTDLDVKNINITLVQDETQISAVIRSDQPNESRAKTISSGFNILISGAKGRVKEEEVQALLNAVQFKPDGKSFVINFVMPKADAHKLIDQKIQEARENKKKLQPNSGDGEKESATAKGK